MTVYEEALELLRSHEFVALKKLLADMNPADIAVLFEELTMNEVVLVFRLLPKDLAADTFVEMEADHQQALIHSFSDAELKEVMDELYLDDTVDIIEEMPANVVKKILRNTDRDKRKIINDLLKYPEDSAGSIMTIEFVSLRKTMTVSEALTRIRRTGVDKETIYNCYVNEAKNKLIGMVTAKSLLLSNEDELIGDIMETNIIYVNTMM
ncbi:MAG: magnesium transporter, partial [Clostridia bacterium]|nr:magnesium transporter [Clostridia bacterium]